MSRGSRDRTVSGEVTGLGRRLAPRPARSLRRLLRAAQALLPERTGGTTILGYHLVGAGTDLAIDLPADDFRRQMGELAERCEVVPLHEALDEPPGGPSPPRVALTFDDGYRNLYTAAWPVLRELGLPFSLFLHVDFIAGRHPGAIRSGPRLPPLSWDEIGEMAAAPGVEIGSHTRSHPDLRRLDGPGLEYELGDSKRELAEHLRRPVDSFCYPRGLRSRRVERVVERHYRFAVVRGGRAVRPGDSPYRLQRVPIRRGMGGSLLPVVRSRVWLEEWIAAAIRAVI